MPVNFILNTFSCPDKFICSSVYKHALKSIEIALGNEALARKAIDHFRQGELEGGELSYTNWGFRLNLIRSKKISPQLSCSLLLILLDLRSLKCKLKDPRALCIPDNRLSIFLPENIFQSFKNPKLVCKKNPCPSTQKPFQMEDGSFGCQNILGLNSVTSGFGNLCRKGQRFSQAKNKCVSRFFG